MSNPQLLFLDTAKLSKQLNSGRIVQRQSSADFADMSLDLL